MTVINRPYVFSFLLIYLLAASAHLGPTRALIFIPLGYLVAFISEFSSIHIGFPYGIYHYIKPERPDELWVFGVPFMDSLSYVFLAYASFSVAIFLLSPIRFKKKRLTILETKDIRESRSVLFLSSLLFMYLDIIIDPVALRGDRWFLGKIYYYPKEGPYFGIPLENFFGWFIVGLILTWIIQFLNKKFSPGPLFNKLYNLPLLKNLGILLYISIIIFNLYVTWIIKENTLFFSSCFIIGALLSLSFFWTIYKIKTQDFIKFPTPPLS